MSKEFTLRPMTAEDCERVVYIDEQCIQNPWSKQDFEDLFRYMDNHYLVAECEGKLVGFVGLIQFIDSADITHIAVLPEYQKNRIGNALMQGILVVARKLGIKTIHLEVRNSNLYAKHMYESLGFETINIRKNYYTNPCEDAIVMMKNITEE
ncbi:MAG: ribosomal protein S18-alanine N-acetyltransferase [Lachnospira sp.]|nr:ribosomal protein S18-alanine N-acetyltransferase [Lachnospira sp.]